MLTWLGVAGQVVPVPARMEQAISHNVFCFAELTGVARVVRTHEP